MRIDGDGATTLFPAFQGMKIEEISNQVIQKTILMWSKSGRRNQCGGLAVKTIKDMVVILKMCLKDYEEFLRIGQQKQNGEISVQKTEVMRLKCGQENSRIL